MDVVGISGSLRSGSYNTALLEAARRVSADTVSIEIVSLEGVPLYNRDVERELGFPAPVAALRDRIGACDALLVATPEYNFSVSGVLKNAWDWFSRAPEAPIDGKPLAIMGAGGRSGTLRAQLHFREIALHNRLRVVQHPQVAVQAFGGAFDDTPDLVDERHLDQVTRLVEALAAEVRRSS